MGSCSREQIITLKQFLFMKYLSIFLILVAIGFTATGKPRKAAPVVQPRVEPTFWWTGMKNPQLQLMVHAENIGTTRVALAYPGCASLG